MLRKHADIHKYFVLMPTVDDIIKRLERFASELQSEETRSRIELIAVNRVLANTKIRIFEDGTATNGTPIGKYSTKPIYMPNALGLPRIQLRGKTGNKTKVVNYYPGGYKEYRADVGRQNSRVDLNLTSSMFGAYQAGKNVFGESVIGFVSEDEAKKMEGNEKRFLKTIAVPSQQEKQAGYDATFFELRLIAEKVFR